MVNPGKDVRQIYAMDLGEKDLVIIRANHKIPEEELQAIDEALRDENTGWKGVMLVMGVDEDLEKMPEPVARELYHSLKVVFDQWEEWAKLLEASQAMCTRCKQLLAAESELVRAKKHLELLRAQMTKEQLVAAEYEIAKAGL